MTNADKRTMLRIVAALAFALFLSPWGSGARAQSSGDMQMMYFRYASVRDCNVYMNYSFWQPNFSLMARNAGRLTPQERAFIAAFNREVQAMSLRAGQGECHPGGGSQQALYNRCMQRQARLGIAEESWSEGRLPAPSNCISPKRASAGTVFLITGPLPTRAMSLSQWIEESEAHAR